MVSSFFSDYCITSKKDFQVKQKFLSNKSFCPTFFKKLAAGGIILIKALK